MQSIATLSVLNQDIKGINISTGRTLDLIEGLKGQIYYYSRGQGFEQGKKIQDRLRDLDKELNILKRNLKDSYLNNI
jgi:hypothetical protein